MTIISLEDLPLFWQGRANALRLLDKHSAVSNETTLEQARVYEECVSELRAAIAQRLTSATTPNP